jgi:hypothetical protein
MLPRLRKVEQIYRERGCVVKVSLKQKRHEFHELTQI